MADSGCLGVSQILGNKASGDSVLRVLGNKARQNCQIVPVLPMYIHSLPEFLFFIKCSEDIKEVRLEGCGEDDVM